MDCLEDQVAEAIGAHGYFAPNAPVYVARAPGRLDVMGGNVDYTGGMVLQGLLRESICVAAQSREDDLVRVWNPSAIRFGWEPRLEFRLGDLHDPEQVRALCEERQGMRWGCYVLGAVCFFLRFYESYGQKGIGLGINLWIDSDLPPNRGVSSSAALEVATLKAVSAAWRIPCEGIALATAGQWVENVVAGAACGIMDQAAIVLGRDNHLLPILCQPCHPFPAVTLPPELCVWGIDSTVSRSTTGIAYEAARAAAFMGYKLICQRERIAVTLDESSRIARWTDERWGGYLSNLPPSEFRQHYEHWLPETMTGQVFLGRAGAHVDPFTKIEAKQEYPVRGAVRYAIEENLRVRRVRSLLESIAGGGSRSTLDLIGEILCQSHRAYSECGLGSSACDELVEQALRAGLPGAKMTGGGGGGVVAILAQAEDRRTVWAIAEQYAASRGVEPNLFEGSSNGVDRSGVRVLQSSFGRGPL
jgi:L-arabinokinase